jgi:hypothetical protein
MEVAMLLREKNIGFNTRTLKYGALAILFLIAIGIRIALYHVVTSDYTAFISQWYDYIKSNGGFAAFKNNFYNYNPPYLYLIALTTYTPIPKLIALKSISVVFDIVLAIFTYLLIRLKYTAPTRHLSEPSCSYLRQLLSSIALRGDNAMRFIHRFVWGVSTSCSKIALDGLVPSLAWQSHSSSKPSSFCQYS